MHEFDEFSEAELQSILRKETTKKNKAFAEYRAVLKSMQDLERLNEQSEERSMMNYSQQIHKLREENALLLKKIKENQKFIRINLQERYDRIQKEKFEMESALTEEKMNVIGILHSEIARRNQEATRLESELRCPTVSIKAISDELQAICDESERRLHSYEQELSNLLSEKESLITYIHILIRRVADLQLLSIQNHLKLQTYVPCLLPKMNRRQSDVSCESNYLPNVHKRKRLLSQPY